VEHATDGSLAARLREQPTDSELDPVDQIPQWLFAADPAFMVAHRALALLAADRDELGRARAQIDATRERTAPLLPRLRRDPGIRAPVADDPVDPAGLHPTHGVVDRVPARRGRAAGGDPVPAP
jgi:hypothetical protein